MALLTVKDLNVFYGNIHAIKGISFEVNEGEIVTLIGANGAGKTSTLHAISGLLRPKSGSITFDGNNLVTTEAHKILRLGLAQVPEGRRIFASLTVMENLELGAYIRAKENLDADFEQIFARLPRLKERRKQLAGTLSGGEQQMLAVGRALMSRPDLLMLDEPSLGLAPLLVHEIFEIIRKINNDGKTVLLVEQNAFAALSIAHYAYILEVGRVVLEGPGKKLLEDPKVKEAYLGG